MVAPTVAMTWAARAGEVSVVAVVDPWASWVSLAMPHWNESPVYIFSLQEEVLCSMLIMLLASSRGGAVAYAY